MKKTLFIILALCSMSYGLSGYSMYKTYVSKDTVTHINLDSNFYRGVNWSNKLADTIDRNFIRWYDFNSHDSTLRYFKVDTIRGNPNIDSITGDITITGSPTISGTLTADTLKLTKGINATRGLFDSLRLGSGSFLKTYAEGSFPCTLKTRDVTVQQIGTAYYTKIGKQVTISFPYLEGVSNSTTLRIYCILPYLPRQQEGSYTENYGYVVLRTASLFVPGLVEITSYNGGEVYLFLNSGSFSTSGPKGCHPFTVNYITE